ncbi:MAG: DUF4235 domain-containing protein [Solirubrobacterales bacterium]|nr:DUF4235 domain-containing protein [Solirubrobacterales bacterium]
MAKVLFIPVSVIGGLLAGLVGKKVFEQVWTMIDDEEPPEPEHRETNWPKLLIAMALEGAIFRAIKAVADHGARVGFYRATGAWPGEERPEPQEQAQA